MLVKSVILILVLTCMGLPAVQSRSIPAPDDDSQVPNNGYQVHVHDAERIPGGSQVPAGINLYRVKALQSIPHNPVHDILRPGYTG